MGSKLLPDLGKLVGKAGKAAGAYSDSMEKSMSKQQSASEKSSDNDKSMSGEARKIGTKVGSYIRKGRKAKGTPSKGTSTSKLRTGSKSMDI